MHCILDGNWLSLKGLAIRLSSTPMAFSLVFPCTIVVEKGGKVIGLVVLTVCF